VNGGPIDEDGVLAQVRRGGLVGAVICCGCLAVRPLVWKGIGAVAGK